MYDEGLVSVLQFSVLKSTIDITDVLVSFNLKIVSYIYIDRSHLGDIADFWRVLINFELT